MNRALNFFNAAGVLLLAILCALQWRHDSRLNLLAINLEKTRLEQASKLADQDALLKHNATDLDDLRDRLERAGVALRDAENKLASAVAEGNQLRTQDDQLQQALKKWRAAVADRDQTIQKAGVQIEKLAIERNDAVMKFNDLAGKCNALVKQPPSGK